MKITTREEFDKTYGNLFSDYMIDQVLFVIKEPTGNCTIYFRQGSASFAFVRNSEEDAVRLAEKIHTAYGDYSFADPLSKIDALGPNANAEAHEEFQRRVKLYGQFQFHNACHLARMIDYHDTHPEVEIPSTIVEYADDTRVLLADLLRGEA